MALRFDPLENELFRDQQRTKFLEMKFAYESQLDEKDRDIKRNAAKADRLRSDLEKKLIIIQQLKEELRSAKLEEEEIEDKTHKLNTTFITTQSEMKLQNKDLKNELIGLKTDQEDQYRTHELELRKVKESFRTKKDGIQEGYKRRFDDMLLTYERLRGAKMEVQSQYNILREFDIGNRMDNEENLRRMEQSVVNEESLLYSSNLNDLDKNILSQEQAYDTLKRKTEENILDLSKKRENYLKTLGQISRDQDSLGCELIDKKITLANMHHDNEKIGLQLKIKKNRIERLENIVRDMKNTMDNLVQHEKEKKHILIEVHNSKNLVSESVREHRHMKIIELEKEIRETGIKLQRKKATLQRMAELLSLNVNKVIVDTVNAHRLQTYKGIL